MKKILNILIAVVFLTACTNEVKEIVSKYPDGSPKVVVYFKKEGDKKIKVREIGYYQSQKEMYSGKYTNEQRSGIWNYLYESGKTFAQADFITNVDVKKWDIVDSTGKPFMSADYKLKVIGMYNNGAPYQVNFTKANEKYVSELYFYPDYKIQMTGKTIEGLREDKWTYYYETGQKWSEGYFKGGVHDNTINTWYENGMKQHEGQYKDGKEAGVWKFYDVKGKQEKEINYDKEIAKK